MNRENQLVEFKESWRDDYLRWVCGFANGHGGVIIIGRNDRGEAVGVKGSSKLLEDLPNKIRDLLGIIVDVNFIQKDGFEQLEINVPAYSNPISYRGRYYIRSGSTLQELKGAALDRFLLQKLPTLITPMSLTYFSAQGRSNPGVGALNGLFAPAAMQNHCHLILK